VQERHVADMLATIERDIDRLLASPLRDAVRAMVRAMVAAHTVDPALHRVLMEQAPRVVPMDRAVDLERRFEALVLAYLEAHRDAVRPRNLGLAAFVVVQVTEALAHAAVLDRPDVLASDELVDEMTELVVRYVSAGSS
jgi:hypothetical protein